MRKQVSMCSLIVFHFTKGDERSKVVGRRGRREWRKLLLQNDGIVRKHGSQRNYSRPTHDGKERTSRL